MSVTFVTRSDWRQVSKLIDILVEANQVRATSRCTPGGVLPGGVPPGGVPPGGVPPGGVPPGGVPPGGVPPGGVPPGGVPPGGVPPGGVPPGGVPPGDVPPGGHVQAGLPFRRNLVRKHMFSSVSRSCHLFVHHL